MIKHLLIALFYLAQVAAVWAEPLYIVSARSELYLCDTDDPRTCSFGNFLRHVVITGLTEGEGIAAIDFRPATGVLYGLAVAAGGGRIYAIDHITGTATPTGTGPRFPLSGSRFGFEFDPTIDRMRITTDTGQNLTVNPDDGSVTTAAPLAYSSNDVNSGKPPGIQGSAYTNNYASAGATVLYAIDTNADVLAVQHPPDSGTLRTIGPLGSRDGFVGFDISGLTGIAYVIYGFAGPGLLNSIDLVTGAQTSIASVFVRPNLSDIPVALATTVGPPSRLLNISTRGRVGGGEDVLIAGFVSREGTTARYVLRAIGPSLSAAGIDSPLDDPVLTLHDKNGVAILSNDDWRSSQEAQISASKLAPTNDTEAAIFATLAPDSYTAIVSGKEGASGLALVEVYQLP